MVCTAFRSPAFLSNQIPSVQRASLEGQGGSWCFQLDSHFGGKRASCQPPPRSRRGITIVWKACGVCVRSFSVSSERSADHSTPAAPRTREKVSSQQHLTGAAADLKERRIPETEFDPPRGKEKILRKCLWHRLRSHGPRWN